MQISIIGSICILLVQGAPLNPHESGILRRHAYEVKPATPPVGKTRSESPNAVQPSDKEEDREAIGNTEGEEHEYNDTGDNDADAYEAGSDYEDGEDNEDVENDGEYEDGDVENDGEYEDGDVEEGEDDEESNGDGGMIEGEGEGDDTKEYGQDGGQGNSSTSDQEEKTPNQPLQNDDNPTSVPAESKPKKQCHAPKPKVDATPNPEPIQNPSYDDDKDSGSSSAGQKDEDVNRGGSGNDSAADDEESEEDDDEYEEYSDEEESYDTDSDLDEVEDGTKVNESEPESPTELNGPSEPEEKSEEGSPITPVTPTPKPAEKKEPVY